MSTIMKMMLIGTLLVGLAPVAYADQGGTQSKLYQQHTYGATAPVWSDRAASAYAQQSGGRRTIRPLVNDDPPGSAWQNRGINEDLGYPGR
jgi:hypothetical protein